MRPELRLLETMREAGWDILLDVPNVYDDEEVCGLIRSLPCHFSSANLACTLTLSGKVTNTGSNSGTAQTDIMALGTGDWDTDITGFTYGNTAGVSGNNGQANKCYIAQASISGTSFGNLNLNSLTNNIGQSLNFSAIKLFLLQIKTADGVKAIRVGPQNQSTPFQGPFGGTGATVYKEVRWTEPIVKEKNAGYACAAGSNTLGLYNPGATSVTYNALILGT